AEGRATGALPAGATWAHEVVSTTPALAGALAHVLRGVVVVDDLAAARAAAREQPELTAVTRAGDVLGAALASGGSAAAPSVLHLHAALDEARSGAARA